MYRRKSSGWMKHLDFIVIDTVSLYVSYVLSYYIRHKEMQLFISSGYRSLAVILMLLAIIIGIFANSFQSVLKRGYYNEFIATVRHVTYVILAAAFYLFITKMGQAYSRETIIITGVLYVVIGYVTRCLWKRNLKKKKHIIMNKPDTLLIVTTSQMLERVIKGINSNNYAFYQIVGIAVTDKNMVGQVINGIPIIANGDNVIEYICREWVDEVFINIPSTDIVSEKLFNQLLEMGVTAHLRLMHASDSIGRRQSIERVGSYTVMTTCVGLVSFRDVALKRIMDVISGIAGCIITGLLFIIMGPIIYLKSPGPILFAQTRVGKNGRKFKIYKFRSMYLDAEKRKQELLDQNKMSNGMMFKVDWDTRIIGSEKGPDKGIGNFIRKYSLDEWPQFYNILKGDMSLIGTRPPTLDEWEKYELHHRARLATKPGLTGMWQVSGRSAITDFEEIVKLDTKYIAEWTIGLDIKILFKTIPAVLLHKGAQ